MRLSCRTRAGKAGPSWIHRFFDKHCRWFIARVIRIILNAERNRNMNNGRCTFIHLRNNQLPEEGKGERRMRKKREESIRSNKPCDARLLSILYPSTENRVTSDFVSSGSRRARPRWMLCARLGTRLSDVSGGGMARKCTFIGPNACAFYKLELLRAVSLSASGRRRRLPSRLR